MNKEEALKYLANAKEFLGKSPIENNRYTDIKYVRTACGTAYLGVLKAIDGYLIKQGLSKKELPKKVEEYEKALKKHTSTHNGKLLDMFRDIYDELHIAGYYRGNIHTVGAVKEILKTARLFIDKLK